MAMTFATSVALSVLLTMLIVSCTAIGFIAGLAWPRGGDL